MKKVSDFQWHVAITLQEQLSVVGFCPECGHSMSFTDNDRSPMNIQSMVQQHSCYQKIVSIPK